MNNDQKDDPVKITVTDNTTPDISSDISDISSEIEQTIPSDETTDDRATLITETVATSPESVDRVEAENLSAPIAVARPEMVTADTKKKNIPAIALTIVLALLLIGVGLAAYFTKLHYDGRINQQAAEIQSLKQASSNDLEQLKESNKTLSSEKDALTAEKTKLEEENKTLTEQLEATRTTDTTSPSTQTQSSLTPPSGNGTQLTRPSRQSSNN